MKKGRIGKTGRRLTALVLSSLFLIACLQAGFPAKAAGPDGWLLGSTPKVASGEEPAANDPAPPESPLPTPGDDSDDGPEAPDDGNSDDTPKEPTDGGLASDKPDEGDLYLAATLSDTVVSLSIEVVLLNWEGNVTTVYPSDLELVVRVNEDAEASEPSFFYALLAPDKDYLASITGDCRLEPFYAPPGYTFEGFRPSDSDELLEAYTVVAGSDGNVTVQVVYSVERAFVVVPSVFSTPLGIVPEEELLQEENVEALQADPDMDDAMNTQNPDDAPSPSPEPNVGDDESGNSGGNASGNSGGNASGNSGGNASGNSGGNASGNSGGNASGNSGGNASDGPDTPESDESASPPPVDGEDAAPPPDPLPDSAEESED